LLLTAAGLGLGLAVAFFSARLLSHLLFGITVRDPLSYLLAGLSLAAVAVLACYLPARRAVRIAPMEVLRNE
jgi:putative ABC transport system permease protein